ncbi:MAG: ABC transporter ATP-binding protein, partial [Chloroflexaceae bacterium]|nr:ABC transporter ATP-binding protein [Chloroflexaceae bacterium]
MGFVFDGLEAEEYDRTYGDRVLVRRVSNYFRPYTGIITIVVVMVLLQSLAQTLVPLVIARGVNTLDAVPTTDQIIRFTLLAAGLGALGWVFNYVQQIYSARAVGTVVLNLRQDAFTAVMQRDLSFYDKFQSGKIVSRVTSDTQEFSNVVTLTVNLASQILLILIISGVLIFVDPVLGLITLAVAPAFVLAALLFRRVARWTSTRAQRMTAQVNAMVRESISGVGVAKGFRQEQTLYEDFQATNQLTYRVRLQRGFVFDTLFPMLDFVAGIGTAIVIFFGGLQVLNGTVSTGDWYLFLRSLALFYIPLTSVASFWSQFQQGLAASERVFALIDAEPKVVQIASEPVEALAGHISFKQLDFSYRPDEPVLTNFSLDIPAGQTIAVVGHTGAGKSSLTRLITRFYEFQGGELLIDGRDIRRLDLHQYRRHLGLVPQVPFLFSGTVADNIRYGQPDATDAAVEQAARAIGGEWINGPA